MTVENFRNLVWNMAKVDGTPYIRNSDIGQLTDLCQTQLNVYASATHCLQSDKVTFTPAIGTASYTLLTVPQNYGETTIPSFLSAAICFVRQVYIDGTALRIYGDELNRPGESSEFEISRGMPNYVTAANNRPSFWWQQSPNTLRFNCPFDLVYSDCWISGRLYHSPLMSDSQILDLVPEDIQLAARFCSIALLDPYSPEKAEALRQVIQPRLQARKNTCADKSAGNAIRGTGTPRVVVNLGRG